MKLDTTHPAPTAHDPGGKVRLWLPADVKGDASFSDCTRYRTLLRRWRGEAFPKRFALFIGMNPSTADGEVNDPTVAREWDFAAREGYDAYVKANVGDYRATHPRDLLADGVIPCSADNIPQIRAQAAKASLVVMCHGVLNRALVDSGRQMTALLIEDGVDLWCFGRNADGSPKHPLYLAKTSQLVRYS
ncbi:MAG: DUF1643 domain-containing protein [Devosia sp.]